MKKSVKCYAVLITAPSAKPYVMTENGVPWLLDRFGTAKREADHQFQPLPLSNRAKQYLRHPDPTISTRRKENAMPKRNKQPTNSELAKCAGIDEATFNLIKDKTLDEMVAFSRIFGLKMCIHLVPQRIPAKKRGKK